jgi:hypothetical protein
MRLSENDERFEVQFILVLHSDSWRGRLLCSKDDVGVVWFHEGGMENGLDPHGRV